MNGGRRERGLALVVVLWGIAALSLIAAAMLAAAMNSAQIGRNAWTQLQVQTRADAGIQLGILSLFDPATAQPFDGRERLVSGLDLPIAVSIQDESGRIDLNYAGRGLLRDYFKSMGVNDADTLADRVIAWRSAMGGDGGKSEVDGQHMGRLFESVADLRFVSGMTPGLIARLAPGLTVYSHRPNFDMRVAPKEVLQVIPGMDGHGADLTIAARRAAAAPRGDAFTVVATARQGRIRFSRKAVILLSGDSQRPYWILDWK